MRKLALIRRTAGIAACVTIAAYCGAARGETAVIAWEQQIGTTAFHESGYYNPVKLMVPDTAGNSVYVGYGRTSSGTVSWVNKLSGVGGLMWSYDLGEGQGATLASDVITDNAGNAIIGGSTTELLSGPNNGGSDGFVAKVGAATQPDWIRQIGTPGDDRVTHIARDAKGNIYVAMGTLLVKLTPSGTVGWQKTAAATHLRIDASGNPIVAGQDASGINWVSKWLPNGHLAWKKRLTDVASTLAVDSYGRIVVGYSNRIAKYSAEGVLQWRRTRAIASNISTDINGDIYVMTGSKMLSKLAGADGIIYWTKNVDPNSSHSVLYLRTADNGNSAVVGSAPPDTGSEKDIYWAAKYDASGNMIWYQRADSPDSWCDRIELADGALHRSGDVFVALNTEYSYGTRFISWGIKFDAIP